MHLLPIQRYHVLTYVKWGLCFFWLSTASAAELNVDVRSRPPEMVISDGAMSGPLLDIISEAATKAGHTVHFSERQFKASYEELKKGSVDILPRTLCTDERVREIEYIGPIGYQEKVIEFLVKPGREESVKTFDDLKRLKIGVKRGTFYFKEFNTASDIQKVESGDDDNMVKMFNGSRFDAMAVLDRRSVLDALEAAGVTEYAFAIYKKKINIGNYYGISPGNRHKAALQAALEDLVRTGRVAALYEKYGATPPWFPEQTIFEPCTGDS
ncbi:ABC transporter substrate-binding protein [Hahella aquimaris]|uniref:substrate-binding periplasmic protein n=1 Tax=Hahella sp. HNIBRBA332 TaxID=3015983 RepID=UPI00273BC887|nr:ABC transporter substrate-binding protein [Hahella sp. HNIBRBA332]WLQ15419.1 ABC transporter substrate-binding protein [Hahella sp. HNIBRBA332]